MSDATVPDGPLVTKLRTLAPWLFESPEETARRVDCEVQRLRLLFELKRQWRRELSASGADVLEDTLEELRVPAPSELMPTPVARPLRRVG